VFGLFKKQITLAEFGQGIVQLASNPLCSDCGRALGTRFENWDGSQGWLRFLERKGISIPTQKLHILLWTHCAIQATCTQFDEGQRRTQNAMNAFPEKLANYDIGLTYNALESIYRGQYKFDPKISPLSNPEASIHYLPDPKAGVLNAKYLIDAFVIPHMPNSSTFIEEFQSYSSTACASIGTVSRAMNHILAKCKI
jgi:hypothetical protein